MSAERRLAAWITSRHAFGLGTCRGRAGVHGETNVLNGCADLLVEVFGPDIGTHARTAIGVSGLPLNCPVVIAAAVALKPGTP